MSFRGLSRADLARETKRSRTAVSYWLSGADHPTRETMDRILVALSLTHAEFYGPIPRIASASRRAV